MRGLFPVFAQERGERPGAALRLHDPFPGPGFRVQYQRFGLSPAARDQLLLLSICVAHRLRSLRERVADVPERGDGLLDRLNVDDVQRNKLYPDIAVLEPGGNPVEQPVLNDVSIRGENQVDEILAQGVDQFLPGVNGQHRDGIAGDEKEVSEVVDPVLDGDVHFQKVHVSRQYGKVDLIAFLAGHPVSGDALDLADVYHVDDRNAVAYSGPDVGIHDPPEPEDDAEFLLLDDVEPAGQDTDHSRGSGPNYDSPAVFRVIIEYGVDDPRTPRQ